jgi:predicted ATPase/transcriptional regulator with XRE-family HTH domain
MKSGAGSFATQLRELRATAGFSQEELAGIAGVSVHAISALERGERRRPQFETVRALSAALDLRGAVREEFLGSARPPGDRRANPTPLPLPLTSLLGRDAEMDTIGRWLIDPSVRLVTVVGPGGVGKTRLALELARTIANQGSTRVVFVSLASLGDPAFVASTIAHALGLAGATALDAARRVSAACADVPTLLVLDNFEHLLGAAPLLAGLLASTATTRILVTSRAPVHIRGEREYAVGPLGMDARAAASPDDLAHVPAIRLFVERIHEAQPDFQLTPGNAPVIAAICRRLDALPLALELAAPWIKALTPEGLLRQLDRNVLLASVGHRDRPARHKTMNAAVSWSYHLLDPDEQRAFRRLGMLPGLFSIDAAEAVLAGDTPASMRRDDALRMVAGLIDKSLLLRAETAAVTRPRYYMLETVRAYAAHELAASGERDDAIEGLIRYHMAHACETEKALAAPRRGATRSSRASRSQFGRALQVC